MFLKCETYKNKIYYTCVKDCYDTEYSIVKDFKLEAFKEHPMGKWNTLIGKEPLKKHTFDTVSKFNNFVYNNRDKIHNNIKPEYQYIRHQRGFEELDKKPRIWLWDIETDVMPDGSFPDPYKYETLPSITLLQISEFDTKKKIILGWKKETEVYKDFDNCIYKKFDNEVDMINAFIKLYRKRKVNILTAWNGNGFDFPYIVKRCKNLDIDYKQLSLFEEFKTERYDKSKDEKYEIEKPIGSYWLDYMDVYKKLTFGGRESWSLSFIANYEGVVNKMDYTVEGFRNIKELFNANYNPDYDLEKKSDLYEAYLNKDIESIKQLSYDVFVKYGIIDVEVMQQLEEKMNLFDVMLSLSQKMGCNIDDSLGTTIPWEVFIYNELYNDNICLPASKLDSDDNIFTGGYVYANVGIHRWNVSEDVASMYPSIMINSNMSPETYIKHIDIPIDLYEEIKELHDLKEPELLIEKWSKEKWEKVTGLLKEHNISMSVNGACFSRDVQGIVPRLVESIFNERKEFKKLMKSSDNELEKKHYDLKQMTAKILINSIYGALGSKFFLLTNTNIAHAVTSYGRYSIRTTGEYIISKLNNMFKTDTVYRSLTDTDSFFLNLDGVVKLYEEKKGKKTNKEISVFIDNIDKKYIQAWIREFASDVCSKLNGTKDFIYYDREKIGHMIVAGKKKYAVQLIDNEGDFYIKPKIVITGLEIKRSDTPSIIREKLDKSISIMFENDNDKLINFVKEYQEEYEKDMDIDKVALPTGISNISKYEKVKQKSTPIHVRAAMVYNKFIEEHELNKQGYQKIKNGDKVKWFRLKKNPIIDSNVFAYNDVGIFKEFDILKYFDYEEMFERTFHKKVKSLCDVVGMNISRNEQIANDLF